MIISRQNNLVRHLKALEDKKERIKSGSYLIEGEKQVKEAFEKGLDVIAVLGTPELVAPYLYAGARVEEASKDIVDYCSGTTSPQGIVAEIVLPRQKAEIVGSAVVLDGVSDPGNVGTIIRTCAAVGVKNVVLIGCADAYSPKCVRSSMSGVFSVDVFVTDYAGVKKLIAGKRVLVADMGGKSVFGVEADDFALVIGSEAHGVSDRLLSLADEVVSLPMTGNMESLNAGVACSVILYQLLKNKI